MKTEEADLIIGYLQNALIPEQKQRFYAWVNATPENKKLFFETKALYEACTLCRNPVDMQQSWNRLLRKKGIIQSWRRHEWYRIISYAAVGLIAVLVTSAFFLLAPHSKEETLFTTQYIGGDGLQADMAVLPDGTQVSIGAKTHFHYDSEYGKEKRIVYLEGEAYFDVAKNKDKPFIVKIDGHEIEALGTKFNVTAYSGDSLLVTTLLEGSVRLTSRYMHHPTLLKPNEQCIYNRDTRLARVTQVDAAQVTAWTSGYYYFHEQTLDAILYRLGHIYGVTFAIHSESLKKRSFTGTFYRGQSIKNIMEIINLSIPIRYRIKDNQIEVSE